MQHFQGKNIGWVRVNQISFITYIILKNNVDLDKLTSDEPADQDTYCSSSTQVIDQTYEITSFNLGLNNIYFITQYICIHEVTI